MSEYDEALTKAPPATRVAIKKFLEGEREHPVLLYHVLGTGTTAYKATKAQALYKDTPEGDQKCANCEFAYKKAARERYICSWVRGHITPSAWCKWWQPVTD